MLKATRTNGAIFNRQDEYVMKSELPERLMPILEQAYRLAPRSDERFQRSGAAA
jgi:hypothetical protein